MAPRRPRKPAHAIPKTPARRGPVCQGAEATPQLFQNIIEFLPDATFVIDADKRIVAWNQALEVMTGCPKSAMLGQGDFAYSVAFYGHRRPMLIDLIGDCHTEAELQYDYVRRQGELVFAETYNGRLFGGKGAFVWGMAGPLRDQDGVVCGAIESVRDISDRRQAEAALRESEGKYRLLADNTAELVAMLDLGGRFTYASPSFTRTLGWAVADVNGMLYADFIHPEDLGALQADLNELGRTGQLVGEYRIRCRGGEYIWVEGVAQLLRSAEGRASCYLVGGRDITRRKDAEEELQRHREHLEELVSARTAELAEAKNRAEAADRLKSAFLATMSHELRTPLNSILGFTTILESGLAGSLNDEQTTQLGMVHSSAEHLLELITDVLDLSKIEAGQLEVEIAEVDLGECLSKAVGAISPLACKKNLSIQTTIGVGAGTVTGDRRRVEQVLLNLLSNAVKFTARGGVFVTCSAQGSRVITSVRDTGIGIRSEDMAKLFRPFHQLEGGLTRRYDGTGLGLSVCQRLVEMLGGEVWVQSEWGRGSTFSFSLPAAGRSG